MKSFHHLVTNSRDPRKPNRKLHVELLETRRMMAANLSIDLSDCTANVRGTIFEDTAYVGNVSNQAAAARQQNAATMSTPFGNNTMGEATNFGTVTATSITRSGSVGGSDPVDYWTFRPNTNGVAPSGRIRTTIQLSGLSADIDIQLLNATGNVLASSTRGGSSSESITANLNQNQQYFLKIYPYGSASSDYQLTITTPSVASGDDTMAGATDFGTVTSTSITKIGAVGGSDPVDYWKFRPNTNGIALNGQIRTIIQLSGLNADIDIQLLDAAGNVLASSTRGGSSSESITANLNQNQQYFLKIYPYGSASSNYQLTIRTSLADDRFEQNDSLASASNLGTISGRQLFSNLIMADAADWYRFRTDRPGDSAAHVTIRFQHQQGDLDIRLYDSSGQLVRQSTGVTNTERISLNGMAAGEYFLIVYGYQGVPNPNYSLEIDPGSASVGNGGGTLWLNFDGATISNQALRRWAGSDWTSSVGSDLDPEGDGIGVQQFLQGTSGWSQREQVIQQILSRVQNDLNPYGIQVRRWNGLAVENRGDTTIFLGTSGLGHVAGDIDYGNNNRTDIAFVANEWWGNAADTALALADVVLHEAGHTYGLFHVNTMVGGRAQAESMGLRYSEPNQSLWVQDTSFLNRTFVEYLNHGGGRGSQNAHQTMLRNFGLAANPSASTMVQFAANPSGVFTLTTSASSDLILAQRLDGGAIQLDVNGQMFQLSNDTRQIHIFTQGDSRDQVVLANALGIELIVDRSTRSQTHGNKVSSGLVAAWNGSRIPRHSLMDHDHTDQHGHGHEHGSEASGEGHYDVLPMLVYSASELARSIPPAVAIALLEADEFSLPEEGSLLSSENDYAVETVGPHAEARRLVGPFEQFDDSSREELTDLSTLDDELAELDLLWIEHTGILPALV